MTSLKKHNIITDPNHGFRAGFSCETQLLATMHDLFSSFDTGTQRDIAVLGFSNAFDTVTGSKLLKNIIPLWNWRHNSRMAKKIPDWKNNEKAFAMVTFRKKYSLILAFHKAQS